MKFQTGLLLTIIVLLLMVFLFIIPGCKNKTETQEQVFDWYKRNILPTGAEQITDLGNNNLTYQITIGDTRFLILHQSKWIIDGYSCPVSGTTVLMSWKLPAEKVETK